MGAHGGTHTLGRAGLCKGRVLLQGASRFRGLRAESGAESQLMHIALFGGSFDPPHVGHVLAATYAYSVGGVDEVWVLPVAQHPYHKSLSPWDQRWALCQAAFGGLGFVRLKDDEQRNPEGYSFNLVEALQRAHPGHHWSLVGGTDTAKDLLNWHRGAELAHKIAVIAVPRRGYDHVEHALPAVSSSQIRTSLHDRTDITGLVPAAVQRLINTHGWYA